MAYALTGATIASTDADGAIKLWDVRMVAEIRTIAASKYPANKAAFDASSAVGGRLAAVGCVRMGSFCRDGRFEE